MPRNYVRKGNYRPRSVGKGVKNVGVSIPEGLLKLIDAMVAGGLGASRQDVILRSIAAFAGRLELDGLLNSSPELDQRITKIVDDV